MGAGTRPVYPPLPQHRRTPPSNRKWLPYAIVGGSVAFGITMVVGIVGLLLMMYLASARIPTGVTVAGIDLGGESSDTATASLAALSNRAITATDGSRSWQISLSDLGVKVDVDSTLEAAEKAVPGTALQPRYTIDLNQAQVGLISLSNVANIPAVPGNPPQIGRAIDIPVILDRLRVDVNGELADGVLELNMIGVAPPHRKPHHHIRARRPPTLSSRGRNWRSSPVTMLWT